MTTAGLLLLGMFLAVCVALMSGFPVAFALASGAMLFAFFAASLGAFDLTFINFFPSRIYVIMTNEILIAAPLFVFMGIMLERSKVAEELLETMGQLFGPIRGGLGISVCVVGALLAASTGIVGATVMTIGLLSLPTMLKRGYDAKLACGTICASGTLGQIIPPSIVLVVLGDQISNAYSEAQRELGNFSPDPVSVGDLFAGALLPGLALVGIYIAYVFILGWVRPDVAPAIARDTLDTQDGAMFARVLRALVAPVVLIVAVLGSILGGIATPTEGAAVGAVGAVFLGALRFGSSRAVHFAAACLILLLVLTATLDLRTGRSDVTLLEQIGIYLAAGCCIGAAYGLISALRNIHAHGLLIEVTRSTAKISAMVFTIVIGAQMFSLVFRGLGGDDMVHDFLGGLPGGVTSALILVMLVMFLMGFFLDFIEITFVVVPIVAPVLLLLGLDPVWLGIMIAVNLQTSFLTPPFGFALFYMRGVAPPSVRTGDIYWGVAPYVAMQLSMLLILSLFPGLATWLPGLIYD